MERFKQNLVIKEPKLILNGALDLQESTSCFWYKQFFALTQSFVQFDQILELSGVENLTGSSLVLELIQCPGACFISCLFNLKDKAAKIVF